MVLDSEITLRKENWHGGDWDETQYGAHVMRRKGCAMQNQGSPKTAECVVQLCCYCDVDKTRNSGNSDNVNIGRKSRKGVLKPLII